MVDKTGLKDRVTLSVEAKDEAINKEEVITSVQEMFQNRCRIRADMVQLAAKGTIPFEANAIGVRES